MAARLRFRKARYVQGEWTIYVGTNTAFTVTTRKWEELTPEDVGRIATAINSDGCTGVPDFYLHCCTIHDFWYTTHHDINGHPITRQEADRRFRECIQSRSRFGGLSPMAWWRWLGVRLFGGSAWEA